MIQSIEQRIAEELGVHLRQVVAAIQLLDEGATVPFIARYRKEATEGLDDTALRTLEERLHYLRELEERRVVVRNSIAEQGKLTEELAAAIDAADTKTRLEDLYLPYKPKRRTKARIAREAGLAPLAEGLLADPTQDPEQAAAAYVDPEKGVADVAVALEGARHILMETFAEDAELLGRLREYLWENACMESKMVEGKEQEGAKFSDYFDARETLKTLPSHRVLAQLRGRNEGVLALNVALSNLKGEDFGPSCEAVVYERFGLRDAGRPADRWLLEGARLAWRIKIYTHLSLELTNRLREQAEEEAIRVFASNLHDLLLAAPAGAHSILGLDPGLRTGVKVAVVDTTGKIVATGTIYPHAPRNDWEGSLNTLTLLCQKFRVELISIGNGTASRETDRLALDLIHRHPELKLRKVVVSEAGASVYSASEFAARELPDLDVSLRGAVSIARRLQDPLAELVKIDPKSIGVGQYQHDVSQTHLVKSLDAVVEDCVNAVGVDVNTASVPLLSRVAGLSPVIARNIVELRDSRGPFQHRLQLREVPRLGPKTFEQAAGFLRITGGSNPLDASAVHPEAYPVVERIVARTGKPIHALLGDASFLRTLKPTDYTDERFGIPTVTDIIKELEKPGRDPRPEFRTATFLEGVNEMKDLTPGMMLEGIVTNVTNFGAFVDVGVHQDGLVHISAMSDKFVKDPREVVKAGDLVKVKVMEVDVPRKRIALSMRTSDPVQPEAKNDAPDRRGSSGLRPEARGGVREQQRAPAKAKGNDRRPGEVSIQGTLADAFAQARKQR
ncbi:putative RNA-binding protein YhgF [Gammaproteobacteria bacterium]